MIDAPSMMALWGAVVGAGLYHGVNPGMGWPLAVSAALMDKSQRSLTMALLALAAGHFLAMSVILLPFSLISALVDWDKPFRIGAGLVVLLMGVYLLINRKHPRYLARVKPTRLALWSFLAAMAHGAGLMLVPVFLTLNSSQESVTENILAALLVAAAHTLAMAAACALVAFFVYRWIGLRFISRSWFNLDIVWALSLIIVGGAGIVGATHSGMMHH
ncbi:MAG: hypothetical protein AB8B97_28400 [Granulosicoccus sp.]